MKDEKFKSIHATINKILDPKNFIGRYEKETKKEEETD